MEYTVKEVIDALPYDQLLKLEFDLAHGSMETRKTVEKRIKFLESSNKKVCATCGTEIDSQSDHVFTVLFGIADFRKKASCCGIDCFTVFVEKLKAYEKISAK